MDKFIELYNKYKCSKIITSHIFDTGIYVLKSSQLIEEKEFIFHKLKEIYPNDPSIYYYMGFELKNVDDDKA